MAEPKTVMEACVAFLEGQPQRGLVHYTDLTAALAEREPGRFAPVPGRVTPHFTIWRTLGESGSFTAVGGGWFRYHAWPESAKDKLRLSKDNGASLKAAVRELRASRNAGAMAGLNLILDDEAHRADAVALRATAMARAKALLEAGPLDNAGVEELLRQWSLTSGRQLGSSQSNRFAPAFVGMYVRKYQEQLETVNAWVEALRAAAPDDESVKSTLSDLWVRKDLSFAGVIFPTMVLHTLDPARWFPWTESLAKGLKAETLSGGRGYGSGAGYLDYCAGVRDLIAREGLSPHLADAALTRASLTAPEEEPDAEPEPVAPAPGPGTAPAPAPAPARRAYSLEQLQADTHLTLDLLSEVVNAARFDPKTRGAVGQIVLYGPPGTGKTWLAERVAQHLVDGDMSRVELLQLHPAFSYEHMMEGFQPQVSNGQLLFQLQDGALKRLCARIAARPEPHVLILDEMNRGDLPQIFGELMYLLSRRGKGTRVKLARSGEELTLPDQLTIIGTMNTADRSISHVDFALRRRFRFFKVGPEPEVVQAVALERWGSDWAGVLVELLNTLNSALGKAGRGYEIGHSYFLDVEGSLEDRGDRALHEVWEREILPALEDWLDFDDRSLKAFQWDQMPGLIWRRARAARDASGEPGP